MNGIFVYQPPKRASPINEFLDGLDPRLREKLILQLIRLSRTPRNALREPHFKHISLDRFSQLYELREKGGVLARIVFAYRPGGGVILLHAFIKRQNRDTVQALEQSIKKLSEVGEHPESVVEFRVKEEICEKAQ